MKPHRRSLIVGIMALLATFGISAALYAMTVQPVVLDLTTSGRGMSAGHHRRKHLRPAAPVELRIETLELTADGVAPTGKDSGELAVFPPQALIRPASGKVSASNMLASPRSTRSRHFFVTVAQLPVAQTGPPTSSCCTIFRFSSASHRGSHAVPQLIAGAEIARNADGAPVPAISCCQRGRGAWLSFQRTPAHRAV